jgi:hypothetical protein
VEVPGVVRLGGIITITITTVLLFYSDIIIYFSIIKISNKYLFVLTI